MSESFPDDKIRRLALVLVRPELMTITIAAIFRCCVSPQARLKFQKLFFRDFRFIRPILFCRFVVRCHDLFLTVRIIALSARSSLRGHSVADSYLLRTVLFLFVDPLSVRCIAARPIRAALTGSVSRLNCQ